MQKISIFFLVAALSLGFLGFYSHQAGAEEKGTAEVFKKHCASCHGEQGKGDGPATKVMKNIKMTDWTDKEALAKYSDEDLYKIISEGGAAVGKSKAMPSYKTKLSEKEMRDLVTFLRSLSKK